MLFCINCCTQFSLENVDCLLRKVVNVNATEVQKRPRKIWKLHTVTLLPHSLAGLRSAYDYDHPEDCVIMRELRREDS